MAPATAHFVFWTAAAACGVAQAVILWFAIRRYDAAGRAYDEDRRAEPRRSAERWTPDRRRASAPGSPAGPTSELAWSVLPAVALALLLAATWAALP